LQHTGGQIDGRETLPAHGVLDVGQHRRDRPRRHPRVAEQIGTAGDAFLGLKVYQQEGRRPHGCALVPNGRAIGTSTAMA
jgi:hypothetical protein